MLIAIYTAGLTFTFGFLFIDAIVKLLQRGQQHKQYRLACKQLPALLETKKKPELQLIATELGIAWKNSRGKGKHMLIAQLRTAIYLELKV